MRDNAFVYVYDFLKDGSTDSSVIKACMDYASASYEKPVVIFDRKDWHIDEAVLLSPDMTVIIDGCSIKQNNKVFDNVFRGTNVVADPEHPFGRPLEVGGIRNIKIMGKNGAKIIGCDINRTGFHQVLNEEQLMVGDFWGWRTHQISLSNCKGFEIADIEFLQTRGWTMSFDSCTEGYIHDIHVVSKVKNGDGVNLRSGCSFCKVENVTGFTSDDSVACTALCVPNRKYPSNNYLYPSEPYNCLWDGSNARDKDIHDISISEIHSGGFHHGVICLAAGGLRVYNINIKNVKEDKEGKRESAIKIYTGYGDGYNANDIHNITVDTVEANISDFAVLCNAEVSDVVLKNVPDDKCKLEFTDGITIIK